MSEPDRAYSEQDVKATLDNCRLTYLYEPDRSRLRQRVSQILSGGMLVAWFQGAPGCKSGMVPGRSVICDPSNRWARENVNRFFKQCPVETPLPVVAAAGGASWHDGDLERFVLQQVVVAAEVRSQMIGAIERDGRVEAQGVCEADDDGLFELVREHQARSGVPALIAVPFRAGMDPVVCTPRDAVRTMFSSAIDILVIERFVLAKDQWILGSHAS